MKTPNPKPYGTIENPILVRSHSDERFYLQCLRSQSGHAFFYHRLGSTMSLEMSKPVDVYELIAQDNSERWVLAISPYHPEAEWIAPEGLELSLRLISPYMALTGTSGLVRHFPIRLPETLDDEIDQDYVKELLDRRPEAEWGSQKVNHILATLGVDRLRC